MTNTEKIVTVLATILVIFCIAFGVYSGNHSKSLGADSQINLITAMSYNTAVSVTTSASVSLLPASSGRSYAIIVNSGANPVWLSLSSQALSTAATASSGIYLAPSGGTYVINESNLYVGPIFAISTTGTSIVTVTAAQ